MKNLKKTSLFLLMIGSVLAGCRKEVNDMGYSFLLFMGK
jgi:hypothetical protein